MSLHFKTIRSSSSGNCVMLWTEHTTIMIDCGFKTQRDCYEVLDGFARRLDGVLISHTHGDHIGYSSLRALGETRATVHCHEQIVNDIRRKQRATGPEPIFKTFNGHAFVVGDFEVQAVRLPHDPYTPTFGFVIQAGRNIDRKKVIVCTDFHDYDPIVDHFTNADFVFVESNHDPDLLRQRWNPASLYHMSNPKTAELLCKAKKSGAFKPNRVMLGHLSDERNTESLAIDAIVDRFTIEGVQIDFDLEVAPKYKPSRTIRIA